MLSAMLMKKVFSRTFCFNTRKTYCEVRKMATTTDKIDFEYVKQKLATREITLLDVRENQELTYDGMIPGSINIPLGQLEEAFKLHSAAFEIKYGFPKPDILANNIVLSCKSGRRATVAKVTLKAMGYQNPQVYSGSFQDWIEKGGQFERAKRVVRLDEL